MPPSHVVGSCRDTCCEHLTLLVMVDLCARRLEAIPRAAFPSNRRGEPSAIMLNDTTNARVHERVCNLRLLHRTPN